MPTDRETFETFPALNRADTATQISGDLLPGMEPLRFGWLRPRAGMGNNAHAAQSAG
jgi:hypothetical protein